MFKYNGEGVNPSGGRAIPPGDYILKIVDTEEGKSKVKDDGTGGDYQVVVNFQVAEGDYKGRNIKFHRVTFLPRTHKAAGMAVHFLKVIGQPCEGEYEVNHIKWRGALLKAKVIEDEFNGYVNNKVAWVDEVESKKADELESVPF